MGDPYTTSIIEHDSSGIPTLDFRFDKVVRGSRVVIVKQFKHDKENKEYDKAAYDMFQEIRRIP